MRGGKINKTRARTERMIPQSDSKKSEVSFVITVQEARSSMP